MLSGWDNIDAVIVDPDGSVVMLETKVTELRRKRTLLRRTARQLELFNRRLIRYAFYFDDSGLTPYPTHCGFAPQSRFSSQDVEDFLDSYQNQVRGLASTVALCDLVKTDFQLAALRVGIWGFSASIEARLKAFGTPVFFKAVFALEHAWFVSHLCHPPRFKPSAYIAGASL